MTRDWPTLDERKMQKATAPDACRRALDAIAERHGVAPSMAAGVALTAQRSAVDGVVDHLRKAYGLSDSQTSQLGYFRRGAVYSCVNQRADMLSGLSISV